MINFDYIAKKDVKNQSPIWQKKFVITRIKKKKIGGSGSEKTNSFFNLINYQPDIHKMYLYAKDPNEAKYQLLFNKRENSDLKHFSDFEARIILIVLLILLQNAI